MAAITNPPFMHQKGNPPFHLRDLEPAEFDQLERMRLMHVRAHQMDRPPEQPAPSQTPDTDS